MYDRGRTRLPSVRSPPEETLILKSIYRHQSRYCYAGSSPRSFSVQPFARSGWKAEGFFGTSLFPCSKIYCLRQLRDHINLLRSEHPISLENSLLVPHLEKLRLDRTNCSPLCDSGCKIDESFRISFCHDFRGSCKTISISSATQNVPFHIAPATPFLRLTTPGFALIPSSVRPSARSGCKIGDFMLYILLHFSGNKESFWSSSEYHLSPGLSLQYVRDLLIMVLSVSLGDVLPAAIDAGHIASVLRSSTTWVLWFLSRLGLSRDILSRLVSMPTIDAENRVCMAGDRRTLKL